MERTRRVVLGGVIMGLVALILVAIPAPPAGAVWRGALPTGLQARAGTNTDMTMSGTGAGQSVTGFIADPTNPFDPVLDGYPTSNPTTGFTAKNEGFAGIIYGTPAGGGPTLLLYCFDILTDTYAGIGYALGTWDAANVPNVGYVAQILDSYYPFVPTEPSGLANTNQMAAAVQAAIWFFSDRYVLSTSDPLHDTVASIVAATIAKGPVPAPAPPTLTITPTDASGPSTAAVVGPYTVDSATGSATVTAAGAEMFADAGATQPISNGTSVTTPKAIWLKSTGPLSAVLQATATAKVPQNNVYLYDGNTAGVSDAQKLILSLEADLTTTVTATAEFKPVGSLRVTKTIAGPAARHQGQVVIQAVCDGTPLSPAFVLPSGTPAGTSSRTYTGIPAGSICTVTETANGQTSSLAPVEVSGDGQQVTVPEGSTITAAITDTYNFIPGSLDISKLITGPGATLRGGVTISVVCNGVPLPSYVIPASTTPGDVQPMHYANIPANASCTISELTAGSNSEVTASVSASVDGSPATLPVTVTVPAAAHVEVDVTDVYNLNPGQLVVTKTIDGPAAGDQGPVTITVSCNGVDLAPFTIDADATGTHTMTYPDLPADAVCEVLETVNGTTSTIAAAVTIDNGEPVIPPGGTETTTITDTYTASVLVVNKTITGDGAGHQDAVTITVACVENGVLVTLPNFVIPAGTPAGETSMEYSDIPVGSSCTVTEAVNGANTSVTVDTTVVPAQPVSVDPAATVDVTDDYTRVTGSLEVTKDITGSAAGHQGQVTIQVSCVGVPASQTPPFVIPAGTTGTVSSPPYDLIPAGTKCFVAETVNGSTATAVVTVSEPLQSETIVADETQTATITDTVTSVPGSLIVGKILGGPFVGQQGPITITVTCGTTALPVFTIPSKARAGLQTHTYDNILAGSSCTVTETTDGATSTVETTVLPNNTQTVTVPAGTTVPVVFADLFSDTPGVLTVSKTIAGNDAGHQGQIAILVDCGEPIDQFAFLIPAATPAGSVSRSFDGIPAGSTCTVTETSTGATSTILVATSVTGNGKAPISADQTASVQLTDTFTAVAVAGPAPTIAAALPTTGASPPIPELLELAGAALAAGAVIVAFGGLRRYQPRSGPRVKRRRPDG